MVNPSTSPKDKDNNPLLIVQAELLQTVLATEAYPWLVDENTEHYGNQAEAVGQALEISDDEATHKWQELSKQLSHTSGTEGVVAQLKQKFANRLPADILSRIGEKAQQLTSGKTAQPSSILEQMMACVQDVLSTVADDDLRVMARPMAMAMRGSSTEDFIEATMKSIRNADWETLSPIEQARLSLAAARYAITQAENQE